jgi:hypothetical protein
MDHIGGNDAGCAGQPEAKPRRFSSFLLRRELNVYGKPILSPLLRMIGDREL